ncbi:monocarboxylate transporter 13-like isoform X2 [Acanthaster planci]|uniref:Monocarboxylate transporter 13-like isoform X2 n=1 Tax=Acanthaster planci TaxID=133434 RepID=A0A8B7Z9B3_ACAPL|nr:monocarboxylate transporter 13-like isoform X2 [Acanthaster planci]
MKHSNVSQANLHVLLDDSCKTALVYFLLQKNGRPANLLTITSREMESTPQSSWLDRHRRTSRYRGIFVVLIVSVQLFIASGPVYAYNVLFLSFEDEFKAGAALTGVFVFAPLFRALTALYGWRNALRIIGGGYFLLSAACGVFLASPVTIESEAPEMGREGGSGEDIPPDAASKLVGGKGADEEETLQRRFVRALLQADLWLWLFGFMLSNVAWTFFLINYASFMEHDRSFTTDQITQALVLGAVGEILGKVVLSLLGDRLPCLKIYEVVATGVLAAVACGLVTVLHNVTTILIFSFVLGPVRSVSYASPYPSAMEIFGDYGSNLVTVILLIPIGIGSFLGGPVTGPTAPSCMGKGQESDDKVTLVVAYTTRWETTQLPCS